MDGGDLFEQKHIICHYVVVVVVAWVWDVISVSCQHLCQHSSRDSGQEGEEQEQEEEKGDLMKRGVWLEWKEKEEDEDEDEKKKRYIRVDREGRKMRNKTWVSNEWWMGSERRRLMGGERK